MSTILRSLKRLENQKEGLSGKRTAAIADFSTRQSMHHAVRFAWFKSRLIRWCMLIIVCAAGAAILYTYHHRSGPPATPPASHPSHPVQADREIPPTGQKPPTAAVEHQPGVQMGSRSIASARHGTAPRRSIPPGPKLEPSDVLASKPAPSVMGRIPVAGAPHPDEAATAGIAPATLSAESGRAGGAERSRPEPAGPPTQTEPSEIMAGGISRADHKGSGEEQPRFANAERMTDGRLTVQAIVWAANAGDRMTVINNRIVREGGTIDGFSIVGIGEDAVYVKEGARLLKVPIGAP